MRSRAGTVLRFVVAVLVIVFGVLVAYGIWKNPEKATLDAAARGGATGQFIGSSRGTTHYQTAGPDTGRVVVLVHGFSVPYYIWDSTFTALSTAGYKVIRYDTFGRGLSDRPDAVYDGALFDGQLDELLDSLRVSQPIDLMGVSFGGFVTAHYVAGHAKRVRTLTLVDPVAGGGTLPALLTTPIIGPWVWQTKVVPTMADNQASDFLHPEHFPTWAERYRPQMRFTGFGRALLRSRVTLTHTDFDSLYARAARTGIPVLLIWGKQDHTVPIALSDVVRRNVPQIEYFPVDSSGHLPTLEQSALVHAKMVAFLVAHAGTPKP